MKCDICGVNMYATTHHYMDINDNNLYCENCYENILAGEGKVLTAIVPSLKDYEKILRKIKKAIKLKEEEERIKKSLEKYRVKLAKYIQREGEKGKGWGYGLQIKINEDISLSASPLSERDDPPYHNTAERRCLRRCLITPVINAEVN